MKTVLAPRASTILYDLLMSRGEKRPYLLPANICPVVPLTFFKAHVPFDFVDISPQSLSMDLAQAEERLRARVPGYGGLLYAHTYGDASTPQEFFRAVKDRFPEFLLIDDRCLCISEPEAAPGTNADVTLFSTGYSKIVDLGFGGFAFLRDDVVYAHHALNFQPADLEAIQKSYERSISRPEPYTYTDSSWLETDSELPVWRDYADRVCSARESSLAHRKSLNAVYEAVIPGGLQLGEHYQLWRFNVRVTDKARTLRAIFDAQLFASSHYASLSGIMGTGPAPYAKELAGEIVNLFNDDHYTLDMAERTAKIVRGSL